MNDPESELEFVQFLQRKDINMPRDIVAQAKNETFLRDELVKCTRKYNRNSFIKKKHMRDKVNESFH